MMVHRVRPDGLHEQREEAEQESTLGHEQKQFPRRGFIFHSLRQRERKGRAHREQEKREHQVHPRDAGQGAGPLEGRGRFLRVIHPAWQRVRIKRHLAGEQHRQNGQPAQRVEGQRAAGLTGICDHVQKFFLRRQWSRCGQYRRRAQRQATRSATGILPVQLFLLAEIVFMSWTGETPVPLRFTPCRVP